MNRLVVDRAVLAALKGPVVHDQAHELDEAVVLIDLNKAPGPLEYNDKQELVTPYAILYANPATAWTGTFGLPEGQLLLPYQVTMVGQTEDHVNWLVLLLRDRMMGRADNGDFRVEIGGSSVFSRSQSLLGGVEPAEGGLFRAVDRYELEAMTTPNEE